MENITHVSLEYTAISELPYSIRKLVRLRSLELRNCGMVQLPSSIATLPELEMLSIRQCEGLQPSKQDKDVESESLMVLTRPFCLESLQEQQLPFIIQENFEGCDSVNEAEGRIVECNSNVGEDNGKSTTIMENQVRSEKCQPASIDLAMDWDPMELEYQLSYPEG
ncbi:suppressor of npr1-1 [Spatholobus suberectus]|nr:suppressor of npr1-1 [Spatholobus suberectus]